MTLEGERPSPLPSPGVPGEGETRRKIGRVDLLIIAGLLLGTLLLYGRTARFDFINFDDADYVYENPRVHAGLTPDNVVWALRTFHFCNWHPLTWLSYMLDSDLAGARPGWMHFENAMIHAGSAALLFVGLMMMTRARWTSAWVAAIFAWHPQHVESVAWISERKDVLSTFFLFLCVICYVRYVRGPSVGRYIAVMVMLVLGLMAKSMVVTLPCVLLLLDFWPLRRLADSAMAPPKLVKGYRMVLEKAPMFLAAAGCAVATYFAQAATRSIAPLDRLPLKIRLENVCNSYVVYLRQMIVPTHLAVYYPMTPQPAWWIAACVTVLLAMTILAILLVRRWPWVLVGWLWYLGMLVPVIGLVQVGGQSHADRYAYVPSVGIFIAIAWSVRNGVMRSKSLRGPAVVLGVASVAVMLAICWRQVGFWRDSMTIMAHSAEVVPDNFVAIGSLGEAYDSHGDPAKAAELYRKVLQIHPNDSLALYNLALQATKRGDDETALPLYREALWADPTYGAVYNNYGNLLARKGRTDDAILVYRRGIKVDPELMPIQHNLALALAAEGKLDEAIGIWQNVIQIDPSYSDAHESLGDALILSGETASGMEQLRRSLQLQPDRVDAFKSLAWTMATHPNAMFQNAAEAEKLAARAVELTKEDDPIALDTLAAAQARGGKFDLAMQTAQHAVNVAEEQKNGSLAQQIRARIELYRSGKPFTSG